MGKKGKNKKKKQNKQPQVIGKKGK